MIRILHVLDKISVDSGVSSVVMNYYRKLNHCELNFDFMLNEDVDSQTREYIEGNGSKIFIMPRLKTANLFKYIKALKAFYKEHDYEIIHGHVANSAVFYLGLASKKKSPHRIVHAHATKGSDIVWRRPRNWILTRFIKVVANKHVACSNMAAKFLFGKKNNAFILNNAIDTERFQFNAEMRDRIRLEHGLENNLVIGHVGRFAPPKNHFFLIDVFAEVYKKNNNARLMLIGSGELKESIIQKVKNHDIEDVVLFIGSVNNVYDYYNAMDVFTLPSFFEGLGIVAIEAQVSGLPVILSDNVPHEASISKRTLFVPLDKETWCKTLTNAEFDSINRNVKIDDSKFCISAQVQHLCEYYKEML